MAASVNFVLGSNMPVSQKQIAEITGVSQKTVSRVLRNDSTVAPDTRRKVQEASRRHGYSPNAAARAIREGVFNRVACVVMQSGHEGSAAHPNILSYITAAADELAAHEYSLVLEPFRIHPATREFIEPPRLFSELAVDGILAVAASGDVPEVVDRRIAEMYGPLVWLNRAAIDSVPCVLADEAYGARLLTRHLIDLGHRRIGYVGPVGEHFSANERRDGVAEELRSASLDASALLECGREVKTTELVTELLAHRPAVTAVVCYDHVFRRAVSVLAERRGLHIPGDLSVCHLASAWETYADSFPEFTAATVPEEDMARRAGGILLDRIAGRSHPVGAIRLRGDLRIGRSTAAPDGESGVTA